MPLKEDAVCDYMKAITLPKLYRSLRDLVSEVTVPEPSATKARQAIERMIAWDGGALRAIPHPASSCFSSISACEFSRVPSGRTSSTGHGARCTTDVATLPAAMRAHPVRP